MLAQTTKASTFFLPQNRPSAFHGFTQLASLC